MHVSTFGAASGWAYLCRLTDRIYSLLHQEKNDRAGKLAPVSVLAPFQYTLLLWGILFGILVLGDVPSREILIGSAIIVAAGLFLLYNERRPRGGVASAGTVTKDFPRGRTASRRSLDRLSPSEDTL